MKKVTKMRLTDDGWKFIQTDFGNITLSNDFNQYLDMIDPKWREYEAITDTKNETVKFKFRPIIRKLESAMLKAVEDIFAPALGRELLQQRVAQAAGPVGDLADVAVEEEVWRRQGADAQLRKCVGWRSRCVGGAEGSVLSSLKIV